MRWSYDLSRTEDGGWLLTVDAEQEKTNYLLAIPVYIEDKGDDVTTHPLFLLGEKGQAQVKLTSKPSRVTLNDNFEALVQLKR